MGQQMNLFGCWAVSVKGTTTSVATDVNGNYSSICAGNTAILVFKFLGYAPQEVLAGNKTTIDIKITGIGKSVKGCSCHWQ